MREKRLAHGGRLREREEGREREREEGRERERDPTARVHPKKISLINFWPLLEDALDPIFCTVQQNKIRSMKIYLCNLHVAIDFELGLGLVNWKTFFRNSKWLSRGTNKPAQNAPNVPSVEFID